MRKNASRVVLAAELAPGVRRMVLSEALSAFTWVMDRAVRCGDSTVLCHRYPDNLVAAFVPLKRFRLLEKASGVSAEDGCEPPRVSRVQDNYIRKRYYEAMERVVKGGECLVIYCLERPIVALVPYGKFLAAGKVSSEGAFPDAPDSWDETTLLDPLERQRYLRRLASEKERERKTLKKEAIVSGKAKVAYGTVVRRVQSGTPVVLYGYRSEMKTAVFISIKKFKLLKRLSRSRGSGNLRVFRVSATYVRFHYAALMDRVVKNGECAIASCFGRPTVALVPYEIYRFLEDVPVTAPASLPEKVSANEHVSLS